MTENPKDTEEFSASPLKGFAVVDSVTVAKGDADASTKTEKMPPVVVKTEDSDTSNVTGEQSETKGTTFAESLFVIDGHGVGGSNCEKVTEVSEDEVTFVLDRDVEEIDEKASQSTLVITTDDLLSTTYDDSLTVTEEKELTKRLPSTAQATDEEQNKKLVKSKPKREDHSFFWVSNITRHVKATDLKKFFSQVGKVLTAKVLTNGKNYFGYVSMGSPELAARCIKQLNNMIFDGKKITVSKDRPDLRDSKPAIKPEPPRKKQIEPVEQKKEEKCASKEEEEAAKPKIAEFKERKGTEEYSSKDNAVIADLHKKLDRAKAETSRYKYKVLEFQRRHEGMRKKCDSLERDLKDLQFKLRNERRRLNQDREQFEKTRKLEQTRLDADRAVINKELDEVKKLREHLKEKIDEFKAQSKKVAKRRSRSPVVVRGRNLRARSPPLRHNNASNEFRPEERMEKKRKRVEISRGRTPPPPPKLSEVVGKKRSDRGSENGVPNRPYFGDVEKRSLSHLPHEYDYRHKSSYAPPPDELRPWPTPFSKDPRRAGPSSQSYPPELRYGTGYQFTPSSISAPPRSYYPEFGKPYGPY